MTLIFLIKMMSRGDRFAYRNVKKSAIYFSFLSNRQQLFYLLKSKWQILTINHLPLTINLSLDDTTRSDDPKQTVPATCLHWPHSHYAFNLLPAV